MARNSATLEGPGINRVSPAAQGQATNQYAVQPALAKEIRANYKMKAKASKHVSRQFQDEFRGNVSVHGDKMTVRRMQTFEDQTGLTGWNPQAMQVELFEFGVKEAIGIQTQYQWDVAGLFADEVEEKAADIAKTDILTYKIDEDVCDTFAAEYQGGTTSYKYRTDASGAIVANSYALAAPGKDSEPGNYPDNRLLTWVAKTLADRGVTDGRRMTALLDGSAAESLGRTAVFTQQYKAGPGASAASSGTLDGVMVGGWNIVKSNVAPARTARVGQADRSGDRADSSCERSNNGSSWRHQRRRHQEGSEDPDGWCWLRQHQTSHSRAERAPDVHGHQ